MSDLTAIARLRCRPPIPAAILDTKRRGSLPCRGLVWKSRLLVGALLLCGLPISLLADDDPHGNDYQTGSEQTGSEQTGSEQTGSEEETIHLFTTFRGNGERGLQFAYSTDGYDWHEVPGHFLQPHVGHHQLMRDPSMVRGPHGTFHLVWTTGWDTDQGFGYASSHDLVHWSQQRFVPVMQYEPTTVNVWAPELFYDADGERFIICWASTIPGRFPDHLEPHGNNQRMYCTVTRDFRQFEPTRLFLDPGFSVIDGCIVPNDGRCVLVFKDNTRPLRNLRVAFGEGPLGPWRDVSEPFTAQLTEGPTVLRRGDDWVIYYDAYGTESYGAVTTSDFKTFTDISQKVSFPDGHKHGTLLEVTRKELDYLLRVGSEQVPGKRIPFESGLSPAEIERRLAQVDEVANSGPFRPRWSSLGKFETPDWYRDAKFGIFIHWGVYSVPAFGSEWYPRNMYRQGSPEFEHHVATYGPQADFGYKDFIPRFHAEKFDAVEWARLFREAGARYVIPVAEHHDGFPMYDSDLTEWSVAKMGPRRDTLGELAKAVRSEGLVLGASSHRAEHWWFFDPGLLVDSDVQDVRFASLYGPANNKRVAESQAEPPDKPFLDDWLLRSCEIVDKYRPKIVYFDWWICQPVFQPYLQRFAAYYYNRGAQWGVPVAINFKEWEGRSFPEGTGVFDIERGKLADIRPDFWQTDTSVSKNSWGYVAKVQYKDVDSIVDDLVDIVSKNGTLLLNIGPKADGTIPLPEQEMLRQIGAWLQVNGEAIYGTRPWTVYGEGPTRDAAGSFSDVERGAYSAEDIRFTTKGDMLYAIALAWPAEGRLVVTSLALEGEPAHGPVTRVSLLGHDGDLAWAQNETGLEVQLPQQPTCDFAVALKIIGPLTASPADLRQEPAGQAAAPTAKETSAEDGADAEYLRVVTQRAARIVEQLQLDDAEQATRVRDIVARRYQLLSEVHDERDAAVARLTRRTSDTSEPLARQIETVRRQADCQLWQSRLGFVAQLLAELTPEQVDAIKDGMTYGVRRATYRRYCELLPELTREQQATILGLLYEAREYALDAGSAEAKHQWFREYKGKINNYLSARGYDLKQAEQAWAERQTGANDD